MSKHSIITNCPTCKKTIEYSTTNKFRPFCSERCKLIDLGEWADEAHRIYSGTPREFDEEAPTIHEKNPN